MQTEPLLISLNDGTKCIDRMHSKNNKQVGNGLGCGHLREQHWRGELKAPLAIASLVRKTGRPPLSDNSNETERDRLMDVFQQAAMVCQ